LKNYICTLLAVILISSGIDLSGQTIRREYWLNISGGTVGALTSSPDYPANPTGVEFPTVFEGPIGFNDFYGSRFRGYVHPPVTGDYVFWISSDDNSELYLGDDEIPASKQLIANVATWTASQQWDKEPNQQSVPIHLEAGRKYYIEALHAEGGGGDNVAVGWQLPNLALERPIPGNRLSPFVLSTNPPSIVDEPVSLSLSEGERAVFRVNAEGGEPLSFQWRQEGADLPLQTFPNLIIDPVTLADDGLLFSCYISNPYGEITTGTVSLTVTPEQVPPIISTMTPAASSLVRHFTELELFFSEPVTGVNAGDLLINGQSANSMSGVGAGPYHFTFNSPTAGTVQLIWAGGHGIVDQSLAANPFAGGGSSVTLNPAAAVPNIVINEFVASNSTGLTDEDGQTGDWIELRNAGATPQNLVGWSLTDDRDVPGRWQLPDVTIPAGGFLVVFASAKDRSAAGSELHSNFSLSRVGEYLGLFNNELPRAEVDGLAPTYPEQRGDYSFGRDSGGAWGYFSTPTPGAANGDSLIEGLAEPPAFSARRGFYDQPFNLHLSAEPGAVIRYTTDGSDPSPTAGTVYSGPINIAETTTLRALAVIPNRVPSVTITHTFLMNVPASISSLPVLSLVTPVENLFGETGIMETNPRNTVNRGAAWERPVSAELIRPGDNGGFHVDAGLRVQGGAYVRERYDPNAGLPFSKYSFRLYFRGDYGQTRLEYPMFPDVPFEEFETISLRAGMNDHSNPFIVDELVRRLYGDTGNVSSHGTLVNLFLNGSYKGYYNPAERIDKDFLRSWHGGTNDWDLIAQFGEVREGDAVKWNEMRNFIISADMSSPANYANAGSLLDVDNFIDYLIVNVYAGTGDWPHNNWRAARERVTGGKFQFIVWDAEWAMGNAGRTVTVNNLTGELAGSSEIAQMFRSLLDNPEFRMRFADRVHRHMFNDGPLMDAQVSARYWDLRKQMAGVLPGMNSYIHQTFIPGRRAVVFDQLATFELYASEHAPVFNQHGGRIPDGFNLSMTAPRGMIYFTMDGTDPRLPADANSTEWTLLTAEAAKKVRVPSVINGGSVLGNSWKGGTEPFNDSGWTNGTGGVGYDNATTYESLIQIDVKSEMLGINGSAFVRIPFDTTGVDLSEVNQLSLNVQYDDGFAAYINGSMVASPNAPDPLLWNSLSTAGHDDSAAVNFQSINITDHLNLVYPGQNVLAIHALNVATNSSDFLINATITARKIVPGQVLPAALAYASPIPLNQPVTVKARSLDNGQWSAMTEATFTPNQLGIPLRITEIMYNPPGGDAYEFIELHNFGFSPVNVSSFSFSGINFLFPAGSSIAGGATIILASDANSGLFAGRYPGVSVRGHFGGDLANGGERIALMDASGNVVTAVTYGDGGGWPEQPDGNGQSLVLVDFLGDPDQPSAWRASSEAVGNPGQLNGPAAVSTVRLNEVMADNTNAVPHEATYPDWVEIQNAGGALADISGWSLTDDGNERKFVFPANTTIPANGYLVVWCDIAATSGLHSGFGLGRNGGSVLLHDAGTNLVDVVSYGLQLSDRSLGRVSGDNSWQLNQPTPGAANQAAVLASSSSLVINEWMANPLAGDDDWFELFNLDLGNPASLQGIFLGNGSALHALRGRSYIAPGGFVRVRADEKAGADHVEFKLPAAGGQIQLYDAAGALMQTVNYSAQSETVSEGRLPDGGVFIQTFPGSASPGAGNYVLSWTGPVINEFMAINEGLVTMANGRVADWIELQNPNGAAFDLTGMSLAFGKATAGEWPFPAGASVPANGHLVIWCDSDLPVSAEVSAEMNAGKSLSGKGARIHLFNSANQLIQTLAFGPQIANMSVGRTGGFWQLLATPTPGVANSAAAATGLATDLRLNEWQSNPSSGDDWVELHNTGSFPVVLDGIYLTDDPSVVGKTKSKLGPNSFIAAGGWLLLVADANTDNGADHLAFSLAAGGEHLRMLQNNLTQLDSMDFGAQMVGTSSGRFPDGQPSVQLFTTTVSPGESNYLPLNNAVINEVLAHTDPPLEDAVEIHNPTGVAVNIGGWFLSDDADILKKFQVAGNVMIPANGYHVFYETEINGGTGSLVPFTFNSARGDAVYLSQADGLGNLTGYRAQIEFGPSFNGVSLGRYASSVGVDFVPLSQRTLWAANAAPRVGPLVVNEIMADPADLVGLAADDAEFVELANVTASIVPLYDPLNPSNVWKLSGGIDFEFPPNMSVPANGRVLVVGFSPVANPAKLAAFRAHYAGSDTVTVAGPYSGRLASTGDTVRIVQPDAPQTSGPDIGLVPYVETERVSYSSIAPWPTVGIGEGASLQRIAAASYGNDPVNWTSGVPTAGTLNSGDPVDADNDGIPDYWETTYGLNPNLTADGALDADQDGISNVGEFRAGTNPQDELSFLKVESVSRNTVLTQISFRAAAGVAYTVEYRDALGTGSWQKLMDVAARYYPGDIVINDTGAPLGERFYRLATPTLP